jgi:thiamine-phosphate pyrophosphorylase
VVTVEQIRLCLVTDPDLGGPRALEDIVARAVAGGVTLVQLRDKQASTRDLIGRAVALLRVLEPFRVPLLINDRVDVALAAGAQGVHLGQTDLPPVLAREILGEEAIIGLSIDALGQELAPDAARADYLGVGPVFATATKADAAPPLGLDGLRAVRQGTDRPIMGIGGITPENAASVLLAGADGVAVVSALMGAADPTAAADRIVAALAGIEAPSGAARRS